MSSDSQDVKLNNLSESKSTKMTRTAVTQAAQEKNEIEKEKVDKEEEEDVTFLICGGNEEGGLKDFSELSSNANNNGNNGSSISLSELTGNTPNSGTTPTANNQQKQNGQNIHTLNASNTIYIENEDTAFGENPCKDLQMVWDNNPELRPWSRLLDVSPWFNYGFTEKTFKEYIIRQLGIRWERIKKQNIETTDDLLNKNSISSSGSHSSINVHPNPNLNINLNANNSNNNVLPNPNSMINNNVQPLPNFYQPNMLYYPPHPHLNVPIPGHPNLFHQPHAYNNFPTHHPSHPMLHHPPIPPNGLNVGNGFPYTARSKKRPPE
ncbi:Pre-mRNA polyadenylation factor [Cryptosporidium felis]|nr:Pre-mRNA polyadenylation factor [Cryptosporidium felis]